MKSSRAWRRVELARRLCRAECRVVSDASQRGELVSVVTLEEAWARLCGEMRTFQSRVRSEGSPSPRSPHHVALSQLEWKRIILSLNEQVFMVTRDHAYISTRNRTSNLRNPELAHECAKWTSSRLLLIAAMSHFGLCLGCLMFLALESASHFITIQDPSFLPPSFHFPTFRFQGRSASPLASLLLREEG